MAGVDINKYISDREAMGRDPDGYNMDLEPWSEAQAKAWAEEDGLILEGVHWEVIHFLRERYLHNGQAKSGRHVLEALEREFAERGGKRYLYTLFPGGPVTQGSRLAGLPLPPYSMDPSFGSHE